MVVVVVVVMMMMMVMLMIHIKKRTLWAPALDCEAPGRAVVLLSSPPPLLGLGLGLYSRMLCEGSPLLFHTTSGPVTPPGMYQCVCRVAQQTAGQTAGCRL